MTASAKGMDMPLWERIEEIFNPFPVCYNNIQLNTCNIAIFFESVKSHLPGIVSLWIVQSQRYRIFFWHIY